MGKGCAFSNATLWLCSIAGSVVAATDSESVSLAAVVAVLGGETSGFLGGPYTSIGVYLYLAGLFGGTLTGGKRSGPG